MRRQRFNNQINHFRASANAVALAKSANHRGPVSKRMRGPSLVEHAPFMPTEDWYEPADQPPSGYRVVVQPPGSGYIHAVTAEEVRDRLAELPDWMLEPLEIVQLSRMTRKKQTFPCYGMQWGNSLYLYPLEESLTEEFLRPPKPSVFNEARQFGGRWFQEGSTWRLEWSMKALKDFYLNNILIHELGHLLDHRNNSYTDRERYAEWFAIEFGYRATQSKRKRIKTVKRRHHSA